jgi:lipid-A-disaccharide synthase
MKKILVITGEASGDLHAANLVREIQKQSSNIQFIGMGGQKMREAGVEIIQDINQLSVIGLTEVIARLPFLYSIFKKIKNLIQQTTFDLIILVDCPGFNLRFAKIAKKAKQKVFYYISPQLWAWHQSRVKIVKKYVDLMAVVFPFEVDFYRRFNINAKFVGHPLVETVKPSMSIDEARKLFNPSSPQSTIHDPQSKNLNPLIGLLPGSRRSEIKRMLPIMIETAELLKEQFPTMQFIMPLASSLSQNDIQPYLNSRNLNIKTISRQTYDVINACDAVMVTSGTATLETTLLNKPFVIIYKVSLLTYLIAKILIKVPFLGLCNLLAGKPIVKEFLQNDAKANLIAKEIAQILTDNSYRQTMQENLQAIRNNLKGEVANATDLILNIIHSY